MLRGKPPKDCLTNIPCKLHLILILVSDGGTGKKRNAIYRLGSFLRHICTHGNWFCVILWHAGNSASNLVPRDKTRGRFGPTANEQKVISTADSWFHGPYKPSINAAPKPQAKIKVGAAAFIITICFKYLKMHDMDFGRYFETCYWMASLTKFMHLILHRATIKERQAWATNGLAWRKHPLALMHVWGTKSRYA